MSLIEVLVTIAVLTLLIAVLLPSLTRARDAARRAACQSNLRQIAHACHAYAADYEDAFPIAQYLDLHRQAFVAWDTIVEFGDPAPARAGLIWEFADGGAVQQCPAYDGPSFTQGDPFTGYNYNTTYIGRGQGEGPYLGMGEAPARRGQIRRTGATALFGDGGWSLGANKFMRAPLDEGVSEETVFAGGQAYRHRQQTNVAYVDGHAESTAARFVKPGAAPRGLEILGWPDNAFLSEDDSAYARK